MAKEPPIAPKNPTGWSFQEIVTVLANFHDDSRGSPQLTNGMLDKDMISDSKSGNWPSILVVDGHLKLL
jgi:hypothetical protein